MPDRPDISDTLANIARLLEVPPSAFAPTADDPATADHAARVHAELSEMMELFIRLAAEDRCTVLAHARRLANREA